MPSVWGVSVQRSLDEALQLLSVAVRNCQDDLWQVPMWRVDPSEIVGETRDVDGRVVNDPARREALVQRWSMPWSVAWHALEVLDYDLSGELSAWAPPAPFAGKPHWQTFTSRPVAWSKAEIGEYVEYCRRRVQDTLVDVTEERAAALLPPAHRYAGMPWAWIVTSLIGHTTAHALQIRQFLQAAGPARRPD